MLLQDTGIFKRNLLFITMSHLIGKILTDNFLLRDEKNKSAMGYEIDTLIICKCGGFQFVLKFTSPLFIYTVKK